MRKIVFFIVSIVVSIVFLWLALRNVSLEEVVVSIRQADGLWVLAAMVSIAIGIWLRAIRWRGLVDFRIPVAKCFHMLNITFFLNLLPLRAGEVARGLLATREKVPFVTAATSIVVERMLDTLLVVVLLVLAIGRLPEAPAAITTPTTLFGIAVVLAFAMLIFFARYPDIGHKTLAFFERLLPFLKRLGVGRLLDHMLDGLKPLTHWRSGAHAVIWTVIPWMISLFTFYALERAVGVDPAQTDLVLGSILAISLASFSVAIPISVAGIGPFQAAVLVAGQAVGMPEAQAVTLGFLFHGINILSYSLWGILGLVAMGVSLSDIMSVRDRPSAEPAAPSA